MHVAGREKLKSGYCEAVTRYGSHMGTCHHFPAHAWARLGDRFLSIEHADDDTTSAQLVAKCAGMLRNGAGWRVPADQL